ncbi:MAG: response regulator [Acidobacteriota bacterium]
MPESQEQTVNVVMADDDDDDCLLVRDAFAQSRQKVKFACVEDGERLLDYLYNRNGFEDLLGSPRPDLILLDLNMPKKGGIEALKQIKADDSLRSIPVVVLTTSKEQEDIARCYGFGANSFVTKPLTFKALVDALNVLGEYWFRTVELPGREKDN